MVFTHRCKSTYKTVCESVNDVSKVCTFNYRILIGSINVYIRKYKWEDRHSLLYDLL